MGVWGCGRVLDDHDAGLLLGVGVEFFVVVIGDLDVGAEAEEAEGVAVEVDVGAGGEPELVVDEFLIEGEVGAGAEGEHAETGVDFAVEAGDEAADLAVLFVDPDGAGGVAGGFFGDAVGFGAGVGGEVEGDGAAVVELDAARAGEIRHGEDAADADDDFAIGRLAGRSLLGFFDVFGDAILLFFLLAGVEVFAVFADEAADLMGVHEEDFVFVGFGLLHAAVFVEFADEVGFVEGVVLLDRVHLALVVAHLVEEGGDIGDRGCGLGRGNEREAEHGAGENGRCRGMDASAGSRQFFRSTRAGGVHHKAAAFKSS